MNQPIPASLIVPPGYRMLGPRTKVRKGDLHLVLHGYNQSKPDDTIGDWLPATECIGERVDWAGNTTIRPVRA